MTEGEKDADTLKARGYVATTAPFGARRWKPRYSETLRAKHVVIVPDRDQPGAAHALAVAYPCCAGYDLSARTAKVPAKVQDGLAAELSTAFTKTGRAK